MKGFSSNKQRGITFIEILIVITIGAVIAAGVLRASEYVWSVTRDSQRNRDLNMIASRIDSYIAKEKGSNRTPEDIDDLNADTLNDSLIRLEWDELFINPAGSIDDSPQIPNSSTKGTFNLIGNKSGQARDFGKLNTGVAVNITENMLIIVAGASCDDNSGSHDLAQDAGALKGRRMVILSRFENDAHVNCTDVGK